MLVEVYGCKSGLTCINQWTSKKECDSRNLKYMYSDKDGESMNSCEPLTDYKYNNEGTDEDMSEIISPTGKRS